MLMNPITCLLKSAQGIWDGKFRNTLFLQASETPHVPLGFEGFEAKAV